MRLSTDEIREFNKIIVVPFNKAKIDAQLDEYIKAKVPDIKENEFFFTRSQLGWVKGTDVVIDIECVGKVLEGGKVNFEVFGETRENAQFAKTYTDLFPRFKPFFMLDDLLAEDSQPEQTLQEFMGDRFGYNTRVFSNMKVIQKEIRKKKK
jgi:hypothetical protein